MKLAKLFDKNGTELKEGDLIQYEDYNGIEEGKPDKIVSYNGEWYTELVPNGKGTLFPIINFPIIKVRNVATDEKIITLETFKKVEKGEQK